MLTCVGSYKNSLRSIQGYYHYLQRLKIPVYKTVIFLVNVVK